MPAPTAPEVQLSVACDPLGGAGGVAAVPVYVEDAALRAPVDGVRSSILHEGALNDLL